MQYEKGGSLLIMGTPRRIILVSETHVLVEGGKSLTIHQAGMYPYSPPGCEKPQNHEVLIQLQLC